MKWFLDASIHAVLWSLFDSCSCFRRRVLSSWEGDQHFLFKQLELISLLEEDERLSHDNITLSHYSHLKSLDTLGLEQPAHPCVWVCLVSSLTCKLIVTVLFSIHTASELHERRSAAISRQTNFCSFFFFFSASCGCCVVCLQLAAKCGLLLRFCHWIGRDTDFVFRSGWII